MARILWIVFCIILAVWLIGFIMDFAGGIIHLLLVVAAVILIINLISGRRAV